MKFSRALAVMAGGVAMMTALTTDKSYGQGIAAIPKNWQLLNYATDSVYGTGVEKA
jgi:hypothetical protein